MEDTVMLKVLVSRELLVQLASPATSDLRDDIGHVLTVDVRQPDEDGFYVPVITRHDGKAAVSG